MLPLLLIPATFLTVAYFYQSKGMSDKKKIATFFEIAKICVQHKDELQYPIFIKEIEDDISMNYVYKLPLGVPSQLIKKLAEVLEEGLYKPVKISFRQRELHIRVFKQQIPEMWNWSRNLLKEHTWRVMMGKALDKHVYHDFEKTPHMCVAGMTRFGKTVFLKNVMTSLILQQPQHVNFFIIDLKEGLEFSPYKELSQVVEVVENPEQALEMLAKVREKMVKQTEVMKKSYFTNIIDTSIKERCFIVVDEGANLCPTQGLPKKQRDLLFMCQEMLSEIARIGGGLGFRLIFCTQYPTSDTLPRQIKQNADAKLGFRLPTAVASQVALDEPGLEDLPSLPGRALFKTDRTEEIQVPYLKDKDMWNLLKQYKVVKRNETSNTQTESETNRDFIHFE
ncbi:FtsK/SpoIIIE domain-containing protein [Bacillus thuringiensis]|uniref:FtsK/SpoIIIE domain-containing protein n=1 Tax=Bacillus thuringiensis TaxID=1428 RepID=UPI000BED82A1|nr:FtsK/SpoIIIE domain-containing protein [Bacillus thuringiensis]EKS8366711.1 cell division protein FtsK [Bacillus cereus]EKS8371548.1 cell division protein FtsK [Bacillus cereus]MBG9504822.1 cell division protein FtsK [Bacillus thuringiensis]MED3391729.1 FtsK/SpoIIIE domain-containing protein [Bacillus thuringiensis]PDY33663.1 cell division protein FtsK [Bacillus thuringiensis]